MSVFYPVPRRSARFILRARASYLVFAILSIALFPAACAAEMPLTLEAAQGRAVEASRQLAAKDHAVVASREMSVAARALPDPVLSVGIDSVPLSGPDRYSLTRDFMTQRRVGVMQELTRSEKRRLRAERFEREAAKSAAEKQGRIADIMRETALAWLDRYYLEAMAMVVAEQVNEAKLDIEAAEAAYRGGRGSQADVFAVRGALAAIEDRQDDIERRVAGARIMLARWTRGDAGLPLGVKPDISRVALDRAVLDNEIVHHPQNQILVREQELAATEANLARAERKADWSVELAYQRRGPAYSDMVSIGVSVPLQWNQGKRQDRELAAKLATVEEVKAEAEESLRTHLAEVRLLLNEWESKQTRIGRYERELLPLANARKEASLAAYRGGKAGLGDVLAARREELDVRLQALQLESDTARLWAQLNFLFPQGSAPGASHFAAGGSK